MASKKSDPKKKSKKSPPKKKAPARVAKVARAPKAPKSEAPRHPRARITALHESKEALAKTLAKSLAREDDDHGVIADRLKTASNQQLLRLHGVVETVKEKYGDRSKLIAKLGTFENKGKDKDYLARLEKLGLPQLLDLVTAHERRTRAEA
jgi:hypothetical protein